MEKFENLLTNEKSVQKVGDSKIVWQEYNIAHIQQLNELQKS